MDCIYTANVEFIVDPKVFYSMVDEFTAICTQFCQMAARGACSSSEIIKRETLEKNFTTKQSTRF